jgi:hypothetical protein
VVGVECGEQHVGYDVDQGYEHGVLSGVENQFIYTFRVNIPFTPPQKPVIRLFVGEKDCGCCPASTCGRS